MVAKVIQRSEGCVVVAFEAETPAEGMVLGLVALEQPDQQVTLHTTSANYASTPKAPQMVITVGTFNLATVAMIQAPTR